MITVALDQLMATSLPGVHFCIPGGRVGQLRSSWFETGQFSEESHNRAFKKVGSHICSLGPQANIPKTPKNI